ncbi:MAG TPA: leucyl/phenylalanyl-tRNA--protein transferase [Actinomycetota bacterium]|nr:leucyl/phenylalanyl-tRNA--protein transferase [Actinomycetota bacterium]
MFAPCRADPPGAAGVMAVEPQPSKHRFPPATSGDERGWVSEGADLEPGTLLLAYRSGLFPMRSPQGQLTWWSPDPRAILPLDGLRVSRSLNRARKKFRTTVDAAFEQVLQGCSDRASGEYVWVTDEVRAAYTQLHELGWAHSVEAWTIGEGEEPELAGGLYGVAIGGLFSGESMFSRRADASKVALVALVELLNAAGGDTAARMIDVQWETPHLASLGAVELPRQEYLRRLGRALEQPHPAWPEPSHGSGEPG